MQARFSGWVRLWSLCASIVMALSLAAAPTVEAVKHGPAALATEAYHRAFHAGPGHSHDVPDGHHDSGDHDHVSAAVLAPPGADVHTAPERKLRPDTMAAAGTIRESPRRPPRLTMI